MQGNKNNDITLIGTTNHKGFDELVGIKTADRLQHLHIIGKTGVGKTNLLRNIVIQDIQAGRGVGVIDPHGDMAEELLEYIPPDRIRDLVYFNPSDLERPLGFNLLEDVPADSRSLVVSQVVSAFKNLWSESWGPRLEYILANSLAALLDYGQPTTLLGVSKILADEDFRERVTRRLSDPMVRMFWEQEFGQKDKRFIQEAIAPIQNKVGQFLMSPTMRNIVGQPKSTVDLGHCMNSGQIFIANLSKGKIGEDKAFLLGSLLITKFQLSALARADIPEEKRERFFLAIDEVSNFMNEGLISILSECRKYGLGLSISAQFLDSYSDKVRSAVLGNVGSLISFRVGSNDADILAKEFDYNFNPEALCDLDKYNVFVKLLVDGIPSRSFSGFTFKETGRRYGQGEKMKRISRERFGRSRAKVEGKINRWLGY